MPRLLTIVLLALFIAPQLASAQVPDSLSFQGFLTDALDNPIDSTGASITFKLYKGAAKIWEETQSVDIDNGVFNVFLGKVSPLDTVTFNQPIDLGITLDGDPPEMTPRTALAASAYARALPGLYTAYLDNGSARGYVVIGGAANNKFDPDAVGATISGGGGIAGLGGGIAGFGSDFAAAGIDVKNEVIGQWATIGGGSNNTADGWGSIGGGSSNDALGPHATVGGGDHNTSGIFYTTTMTTIGGGGYNSVLGSYGTIGGGDHNTTSSDYSTIGGGHLNKAVGVNATVPGGVANHAVGGYSFASGYKARAKHQGSWVWNDHSITSGNDSLLSTGANQFIIRAAGGVGIGTNAPNTQLSVDGNVDFSDSLAIGKATPGTTLDIKGGNWDFSTSEGDVRIGSSTQRLKIGIATSGGGAGVARINAVGTVPRIVLGTNNTDVAGVSPTDFYPTTDNTTSLGTSSKHWTTVYATNGTISTSDRRMKQDVRDIRYGLDQVMDLRPVSFRWKSHPESGENLGLIAQDVHEILPEVVHHGETKDDMLGMNYDQLVPVLIKAIQEQQAIIHAQNSRLEALESRLGSQ